MAEVLFPRPPSLQAHVNFWKRIYVEYGVGDFVLHDRDRVGLVYDVVRVQEPDDPVRAARRAAPAVERLRQKYQGLLLDLAGGGEPSTLGPDAVRVAKAWGCPCPAETLRRAAGNVRVQQGLRERVHVGLTQAKRLMPQIVTILRKHRLPIELAAIPMVESSFNPAAQSKVAAVGLWQIMRTTGKQYLKITRRRDDRRDPIRATEAAAHLLRANYDMLRSWPLAVVAYNHGAGGMRAARRTVGSGAIEDIIAAYAGPRFGFASRNFYPEFLAALDVLTPLLRTQAPAFELRHVQPKETDSIEIPIPTAPIPAPLPAPAPESGVTLPAAPEPPADSSAAGTDQAPGVEGDRPAGPVEEPRSDLTPPAAEEREQEVPEERGGEIPAVPDSEAPART